MVRYFYAYTPFVIIGTIVFLTIPWLGVIALLIVALVALAALAALAWAAVVVPYHMLSHAISSRPHSRRVTSSRPAPARIRLEGVNR